MGEKRVFEGYLYDIGDWGRPMLRMFALPEEHPIWKVADADISDALDDFTDTGQRVRITIETLDDDHLEMEKLERE
jgi:hypothetical protein